MAAKKPARGTGWTQLDEPYRKENTMPSTRVMDPEKISRIVEFINGFWETERRRPRNDEIGAYVGLSKGMVTRYLVHMDSKGIIEYTGDSIITHEMKKEMEMAKMKVVGSVSCGAPTSVEEIQEADADMVRLPRSMVGDGSFYILTANGESMVDAGIESGDLIIVREQRDAKDGDITVFRLSDGTNTLKRYKRGEDHGVLMPENKDKDTYKTYKERGFEIRGVAVMVMKRV